VISNDVSVDDPIAYLNSYNTNDIRACGICGLPTVVQYAQTHCVVCHKLLCTACQDLGHVHNFGPPFGAEPIDF
jgi:hypothetical protein